MMAPCASYQSGGWLAPGYALLISGMPDIDALNAVTRKHIDGPLVMRAGPCPPVSLEVCAAHSRNRTISASILWYLAVTSRPFA
jgi:hypothetical protein